MLSAARMPRGVTVFHIPRKGAPPHKLPTFFQRRRLWIGVARIIYGSNKSSAVLNEEEIVGEQLFQLAVHLTTFDDGQTFADDLASILNVHFDEPRPIVLFDDGERDLANGKNDHAGKK